MFNAPFDTFTNKDKDVYIARVDKVEYDDYNNQIKTYQKPFFYGKKNYQPLEWRNLLAYKELYGEVPHKAAQMLVDSKDNGKFKEFDLAYLYGATPKGETIYGENANYIIKSVRLQNTKILVIMEEIIKED